MLGSWYKNDELARRRVIFYLGLYLATLTTSMIQATASKNLEGKGGLSGWRWMYIITGSMIVVMGLISFPLWQGTAPKPHMLFQTKGDVELARQRLKSRRAEVAGVQLHVSEVEHGERSVCMGKRRVGMTRGRDRLGLWRCTW